MLPPRSKEWKSRFEAVRDGILTRAGFPLKKEEEPREYAVPQRKKPWEAQYEATRDEVLGRIRARAEKIKEEIRQTGQLDLSKSGEDFDPFTLRAERFLGKPDLRKASDRHPRLYKAVDLAKGRLAMLKSLEAALTPYPWAITKGDLKKARLDLIRDLLEVWTIRRSLA